MGVCQQDRVQARCLRFTPGKYCQGTNRGPGSSRGHRRCLKVHREGLVVAMASLLLRLLQAGRHVYQVDSRSARGNAKGKAVGATTSGKSRGRRTIRSLLASLVWPWRANSPDHALEGATSAAARADHGDPVGPVPQRAELAERCEVSRRTIYRDLETLAAAGIPVHYRPERQGYQLARGYSFPLPDALTRRKCLALLALARQWKGERVSTCSVMPATGP